MDSFTHCITNGHRFSAGGPSILSSGAGTLKTEVCNNCLAMRITQEWQVLQDGEWHWVTFGPFVVEDPRVARVTTA